MYVRASSIPFLSRGSANDLDHDTRGQGLGTGTGGREGSRGETL